MAELKPWEAFQQQAPDPMTVPEKPNWLERVGRGAADVTQGIKQLYLMATDPAAAQAYTADVNEERRLYEKGREADGGGVDWWRIGGNIAAGAPAILAGPSMPAAIGTGVALGAAEFNPKGTWSGKGVQGVVGGAAGAAGKLAVDKVLAPAAGKAWDWIAGKVAQARAAGLDDAAVEAAARQAFQEAGVDLTAMEPDQAARALSAMTTTVRRGATSEASAVARKADFDALGIPYTQAQITRNPRQWTAEQRVSKIEGVGDPLQELLLQQSPKFAARVDELRAGTGTAIAPGRDSGWEAAQKAREAVQGWAKAEQGKVTAKYGAVESAPGNEALVDGKTFFERIGPVLETFEDVIPDGIKRRLGELKQGMLPPKGRVGPSSTVDPNADDIITAIRKLGGINPADERIGSLAGQFKFDPSPLGAVWRQPQTATSTGANRMATTAGHDLDRIAEDLYQLGYIDSRDALGDILSKVEDHALGAKQHFSLFYQPKTADPLAASIEALTAQLATKSAPKAPAPREFTVGEAAKLYKLINDRMGGERGPAGRAANELKAALMDVATAQGGDVGEAAKLFGEATKAARERFKALEPDVIAKLADSPEAAYNFVQTNVLRGKPGELASLRRMVEAQDPQAWQGIRAAVIDHLKDVGTNTNGAWNGRAFQEALDGIGNARLQTLFTGDELRLLGTIKRAGFNATVVPERAAVNTSNTASELVNLLSNRETGPGILGRVLANAPLIGPFGAGIVASGKEAMNNAALRRQVAGAINPEAPAAAAAGRDAAAWQALLARLLREGAPPAAALAAAQQVANRQRAAP